MTEPKPVVLPLHHSTILIEAFGKDVATFVGGLSFLTECGCKVMALFLICQKVLREK